MLTKAFYPLLRKSAEANSDKPMGVSRAAVINMSSILGSIESNKEGGLYSYRASKTALNAATKSMSIDFKDSKILCVSMHPGWVKTDMGGKNAPLEVDNACKEMVRTIMDINESNNGAFLQYDGTSLPW
ncbi:C-factor [Pseudolycoriella hygida]|uniref:C-factor n=1 Tax=Pseudolycoriella hygida TaxID=35572 RepID=A0A9Q0MXI4_9DIPT|nr:C-factor [Pseudolycoriella hygida]